MMSIYPSFTYRDVRAALQWLTRVFGLNARIVDDSSDLAIVAHGDGIVLVQPDRPEELHGSHIGKGWAYVAVEDIDEHYERAKAAGADVLNEPHAGPNGMRGYSARDPEGNVWTFGNLRPAP